MAADTSNSWYAFNCFDPRLTGDLIQLLEQSHLWPRVRGMYPNLADAENDPTYTPVWDVTTESHLASWNPPAETIPAFIGACCGSTPEHIRTLRALLTQEN
jgi:S-methylmethionine-dependent homocysteine/selenocysteine methylase